MTAAVGHPTLRLVRVKIGNWTLEGIEQGKYRIENVPVPKIAGAKPTRPRTGGAKNPRPANPNSGATSRKVQDEKGNNTPRSHKPHGQGAGRNKSHAKVNNQAARNKKPAANATAANKPKTVVIQKPKPRRVVNPE